MNRVMIFAYWDKDGVIDDYVLHYLKKAKSVADKIIFSADCDIKPEELPKLENIVTHTINGRHGEYDFGSYKRGYLYAKENGFFDNADELIFCNDSCFGPFYDFENYFNKIDRTKCDYWGMNFNKQFDNHLGSYFIVFGKNVFLSDVFSDFINNIKHQENKQDVVMEYEIVITEYLHKHGFNYDYCYKFPGSFRIYNTIFKEIEKRQYPFFKKSMLVNQFGFIVKWAVNNMRKDIKSDYPFEDIIKYYERINKDTPFKVKFKNFLKMWIPYFIIIPRVKDRIYLFNRWIEWR